MRRFSDLRLRNQLLLTVLGVMVLLVGALSAYDIITTIRSGLRELDSEHQRTLDERKSKLWDNVNFAYETIEAHFSQAGDPEWLEGRYGPDLSRVMDVAESAVQRSLNRQASGLLSTTAARQEALSVLRSLSYNNSADFVWVCDTRRPVPTLILYPGEPGLEGRPAADPAFAVIGKTSGGISEDADSGENLFAAALDATGEGDSAFLFYSWPKLQPDGRYRERPMLAHVRRIPEWNWIIGTSMHVDSAMDEARVASIETLRSMRYDNGAGYFWVTDTRSPHPTMLMDAVMPELEGESLDNPEFEIYGEKQENVFLKIVEMTDIGGSGYLRFDWPKPKSNGELGETAPKEAFVRPFEPWNWIVGSGIYLDDIEAAEIQGRQDMMSRIYLDILVFLGIAAAIMVLALIATSIVIRRITRPIEETVTWSNQLADGDLTGRLENTGQSEIGRQGRNLNDAVESISSLMSRIRDLTGSAETIKASLAESADRTGSAFVSVSENLDRVRDRFSQMDSSIDDSGVAVSQISENIKALENRIDQQAAAVEESTAATEEILASLNNVARTSADKSKSIDGLRAILQNCRGRFGNMNDSIGNLAKAGEDMDQMATVISSIASRTNLLSMNAAIEAAHAGDAGRGFAVVANEMQKLAGNAGTSAKNIKATLSRDVEEIERLSGESGHMNQIYQTLENEVGTMADTLAEISGTMTEISEGSREILESVGTLRLISSEVLTGSKEMTSGNEVVSRTIHGVAEISTEVSGAISAALTDTGDINQAMDDLDSQVRQIVNSISGISREVGRFRL